MLWAMGVILCSYHRERHLQARCVCQMSLSAPEGGGRACRARFCNIWKLRAEAARRGQAAAVEQVEAERVRILAARAPQLLPQEEPQDGASDGAVDAGTHCPLPPPSPHPASLPPPGSLQMSLCSGFLPPMGCSWQTDARTRWPIGSPFMVDSPLELLLLDC